MVVLSAPLGLDSAGGAVLSLGYFTDYEGCPKCKNKTMIPTHSVMAQNILAKSVSSAAKVAPENDCDDTMCPFCAEVIKKKAILCKHCHSNLSQNSNPSSSELKGNHP